jgi:xylulokinase
VIGTLAPEWQARYGLPAAAVVAWSGDNPCSLEGLDLTEEGELGISLGTSDTIFGPMREPRVSPDGYGHVFAAATGGFMGITVFANGSLAREAVRDQYGLDWAGFSEALRATPFGNGGARMRPYFVPEITPFVPEPRVERINLDPADPAKNVRAVVEAQVGAMREYSRWMGVTPRRIIVTGGASRNAEIRQVIEDVFGVPVEVRESSNSAAFGAALRARRAVEGTRA